MLKSYPAAIEAAWAVIETPTPFLSLDDEDFIMKRHPLPPGARAVAAFLGTVVLAVLAAVTVLMPDVAVQSVDSMLHLPAGLDEILSRGFVSH